MSIVQLLTELVYEFKAILDSRQDSMRCFSEHETQLEGWFKGEFLYFLDRQKQAGRISDVQCEVLAGSGRKKVDLALTLGNPPLLVWIELKYWLIGYQKHSRYRARFYFLDKHQGIIKDAEKLNNMQTQYTYILILAVANPGTDWSQSIKGFNDKFHPHFLESLTSPDRFPATYFLGLLRASTR